MKFSAYFKSKIPRKRIRTEQTIKKRTVLHKQLSPAFVQIFRNSHILIALAIGTIPGVIVGGFFGGYSGVYASKLWHFTLQGLTLPFNIPHELLVFGISGIYFGMVTGGAITGTITMVKAFLQADPYQPITHENILNIAEIYISFSLRLTCVLAAGAALGSIRQPGLGTLAGAIIASALYTVLEKSNMDVRLT
jgi:hypothetical protein